MFWDCLGRSQGTQEGDAQNARTVTNSAHEREADVVGYRGRRTVVSVALHLACSVLRLFDHLAPVISAALESARAPAPVPA